VEVPPGSAPVLADTVFDVLAFLSQLQSLLNWKIGGGRPYVVEEAYPLAVPLAPNPSLSANRGLDLPAGSGNRFRDKDRLQKQGI